jgi:hypothetical protein
MIRSEFSALSIPLIGTRSIDAMFLEKKRENEQATESGR